MTDNDVTKLSFEEAMAELEAALQALSRGEIPLAEAVAQYKRGLDMAAQCQRMLREAEGEIRVLLDGVEREWKMEGQEQ